MPQLLIQLPVRGVFGELEPGVVGELLGSILLPGVPGVPGCTGGVELPGSGVKLPGVAGSDGVMLPGLGVKLPGAPGSGGVELPGSVVLPGVPGCPGCPGEVTPRGAGVKLLGAPGSDGVTLPGDLVLSGVVVLGVVSVGTVLGALGVSAVPPGQRELSGKYSQRIFIPSGDSLISAGALVAPLVD